MKCAEWYESGELHIVKNYKNGIRHGIWSYYLPGGSIEKRVKYKRGKILYQLYYEEDKVYKTIDKKGKVRYKKKCDCL